MPFADEMAIKLWQRALCEKLNLKGRIIIAGRQGINGTLGGEIENLKLYVKAMREYSDKFSKADFKWSDGTEKDFPRLSVKVREEIVTFKAADEVVVDQNGIVGGGMHLKPEDVHKLVEEREDVVFFDGRNAYEAQVGRFKDAVVPDTETTRDFLKEIESGKFDHIKDKPVVTYCTGGIRCEILSSLMKNRGFQEVYQIEGGIMRYGEKYGDKGLWEGSLYMFDNRMEIKFSKDSVDIGECSRCGKKTSNFENCSLPSCNKLVLICKDCYGEENGSFCSTECANTQQV